MSQVSGSIESSFRIWNVP